ncbi:MAG: glycosyltransferase family 2 protein [Gammaproteobacteria bacterium]|nr:glycosyltransferase family 2 protein [Gammaproteobacteria bacterium]
MSPEVSIIIPSYRRVPYLRAAVDSVCAQTHQAWELIVVDDGSGSESQRYLEELEQLPAVRVLRLIHTGNPSAVRNAGLELARGEFVAFLDSDDVWLPDKLRLQMQLHRDRPLRRWSYVAMERMHADGAVMADEPRRPTPEGAIFAQLLTLTADVSMSAVVASRALLEELGGFDVAQAYFEDFDLFMRLSQRSEVSVLRQPLVRMRSHESHYSASRVGMLEGRERLLRKVQPYALEIGLGALFRREQRRNQADLARARATAGDRCAALRALWRARAGAWRDRHWWRALASIVKSFLPGGGRPRTARVRG